MNSLLISKNNFISFNKKITFTLNNYLLKKEINLYLHKLIRVYCIKFQFYYINFNKFKSFSFLLNSNLIKLNKTMLFLFCGFMYAKIFLKVGLGFRKKYSLTTNLYNLFVGRRKWAVFKLEPNSFFFNIRRRNIFMFCSTKKKLYENLIKLKYMRKETVFKVKGIMSLNRIIFNRRISRSIIFARRVKFRKMKLKLTKKQSQKK